MQTRKVEDYRPGYPRFTALISAHDPYFMCRRFGKLRARLLLLKQDRLSILEEKLEQIDQDERSPLFLGQSRCDQNSERLSLLSEIETHLADYDEFAERTYRLLNIKTASARDVESLQNWLDGTGCLARKESAYLEHNHDLASLASAGDTATLRIETWVEDRLIRFWPGYHKDRADSISNDSHVYLDVNPWVGQLARFLLLLVITLLLLMPAVICNMIDGLLVRMVVVVVFTMVYLAMLLTLIKSRTMELILAGAAYAAVLVVFVSGSDTLKTA